MTVTEDATTTVAEMAAPLADVSYSPQLGIVLDADLSGNENVELRTALKRAGARFTPSGSATGLGRPSWFIANSYHAGRGWYDRVVTLFTSHGWSVIGSYAGDEVNASADPAALATRVEALQERRIDLENVVGRNIPAGKGEAPGFVGVAYDGTLTPTTFAKALHRDLRTLSSFGDLPDGFEIRAVKAATSRRPCIVQFSANVPKDVGAAAVATITRAVQRRQMALPYPRKDSPQQHATPVVEIARID